MLDLSFFCKYNTADVNCCVILNMSDNSSVYNRDDQQCDIVQVSNGQYYNIRANFASQVTFTDGSEAQIGFCYN